MMLATPMALLALTLLPILAFLYMRREKRFGGLFPAVDPARPAAGGAGKTIWLRHAGFVMRLLALGLIIYAMARPQSGRDPAKRSTEALDIILVVDTSGSMEARDFLVGGKTPTRLAVVKEVMKRFVQDRPDDRIGIVVFGTEAFTQSPLTLDHDALFQYLDAIEIGMAGESTAIGDGLATAVARFKDIEAKSKVVILLTDGSNQAGRVEPLAAARAAQTFDVKVYTIGVGSDGSVPVMQGGRLRTASYDLDEELLQKVASLTGGQYFRAGNTATLLQVYKTIDELEKTKQEVMSFEEREDQYRRYAWAALGLLALELLFGASRFRRVP